LAPLEFLTCHCCRRDPRSRTTTAPRLPRSGSTNKVTTLRVSIANWLRIGKTLVTASISSQTRQRLPSAKTRDELNEQPPILAVVFMVRPDGGPIDLSTRDGGAATGEHTNPLI
jgi:hypothetical protein